MPTITLRNDATEADIQAALDTMPSGATLVLPANKTIIISDGLKINAAAGSVTLDLNGSTLQRAGFESVITVNGKMTAQTAASLGRDASGHLTVSSTGLTHVTVGDYVKIISDDILPNDHGTTTRLGQAMKVVAVNGTSVTLEGELLYGDLYQTNVRVSQFQSGKVDISNGTVRGDLSLSPWPNSLILVRSTVDTHLDKVTVRDGNSMGINFVNTVNALVTQSAALNLKDDTPNGHYGYGVHSSSSINTTINGFYAERVRHAVDDNSVGVYAGHRNTSKYGADIGLTSTNVVADDTTAIAFSWHSEGRLGYLGDSVVFNSQGVVAFRGLDHVAKNVSGSGNIRGIQFFEYGDGDGQRNLVENMQLKETSGYVYYNLGPDPKNNTISNSIFEMTKRGYKLKPDPSVNVINTIVKTSAPGSETITGTAADDRLLGGAGIDVIAGQGGRDYIWGGDGADILTGGAGADRFAYLDVQEGGDVITDFGGEDVIDLSAMAKRYNWIGDPIAQGYVGLVDSGADTIVAVDVDGGGKRFVALLTLSNVDADTLTSSAISTQIIVTDYVVLNPFDDLTGYSRVIGTPGTDTLRGGEGPDLIIGGPGNDKLYGGAGDDVLVGEAGADFLQGGAGVDTASYASATAGVVASLANPSLNTGDAEGDRYSQIRNLTGSFYNDILQGSDAQNTLRGGAGDDRLFGLNGSDTLVGGEGDDELDGGLKNDVLDGGRGDDWLFGGEGYDALTGGAGSDTFVFDPALNNAHPTVTDFVAGEDRIAIANLSVSDPSEIQFIIGSSAAGSSFAPAILYHKASGNVFWDPDGGAAADAIMIGKIAPNLDLSLSDFVLF